MCSVSACKMSSSRSAAGEWLSPSCVTARHFESETSSAERAAEGDFGLGSRGVDSASKSRNEAVEPSASTVGTAGRCSSDPDSDEPGSMLVYSREAATLSDDAGRVVVVGATAPTEVGTVCRPSSCSTPRSTLIHTAGGKSATPCGDGERGGAASRTWTSCSPLSAYE